MDMFGMMGEMMENMVSELLVFVNCFFFFNKYK